MANVNWESKAKEYGSLLKEANQVIKDLKSRMERRRKIAELEGEEKATAEATNVAETAAESAIAAVESAGVAIPEEKKPEIKEAIVAEVTAEVPATEAPESAEEEKMEDLSEDETSAIAKTVDETKDALPEPIVDAVNEALKPEEGKTVASKLAKLVPQLLIKMSKLMTYSAPGSFGEMNRTKTASLDMKKRAAWKDLEKLAAK